jgi:hypothetical protein
MASVSASDFAPGYIGMSKSPAVATPHVKMAIANTAEQSTYLFIAHFLPVESSQ